MKEPNLKNYTTTVPAARSIGEIQGALACFGAKKIMLDIGDDAGVIGISFAIKIENQLVPFNLPANVERVVEYLWDQYRNQTTRGRKDIDDFRVHGQNVAWRVVRDWVLAQLTIVRIGMVEPVEVFMGYLMVDVDRQVTLYDQFKENRLSLPAFNEKQNGVT